MITEYTAARPNRIEVDPITLEIIGGTVESTPREMELQIERTARSGATALGFVAILIFGGAMRFVSATFLALQPGPPVRRRWRPVRRSFPSGGTTRRRSARTASR